MNTQSVEFLPAFSADMTQVLPSNYASPPNFKKTTTGLRATGRGVTKPRTRAWMQRGLNAITTRFKYPSTHWLDLHILATDRRAYQRLRDHLPPDFEFRGMSDMITNYFTDSITKTVREILGAKAVPLFINLVVSNLVQLMVLFYDWGYDYRCRTTHLVRATTICASLCHAIHVATDGRAVKIAKERMTELAEAAFNIYMGQDPTDPDKPLSDFSYRAGPSKLENMLVKGGCAVLTFLLLATTATGLVGLSTAKNTVAHVKCATDMSKATRETTTLISDVVHSLFDSDEQTFQSEVSAMVAEAEKIVTTPYTLFATDNTLREGALTFMTRQTELLTKMRREKDQDNHHLVFTLQQYNSRITERISMLRNMPLQRFRPTTIGVLLRGEKNSGKTVLGSEILPADIARIMEYPSAEVFPIDTDATTKYNLLIRDQQIAYTDDLFREGPSCAITPKIHTMLSEAAKPMQGASLDSKEQMFRFPIYLATCNAPLQLLDARLPFGDRETKDAFWSRFLMLQISRKTKTARENNFTTDFTGAPYDKDYNINFVAWNPTTSQEVIVTSNLTYDQVRDSIIKRLANAELVYQTRLATYFTSAAVGVTNPAVLAEYAKASADIATRVTFLTTLAASVTNHLTIVQAPDGTVTGTIVKLPPVNPVRRNFTPPPPGFPQFTNIADFDYRASGRMFFVVRVQGLMGVGKTTAITSLSTQLADLYGYPVTQASLTTSDSKRPHIYILEDVVLPHTYDAYVAWTNTIHPHSIILIGTNVQLELRRPWLSRAHYLTDTDQHQAGILRRLGGDVALSDGVTHLLTTPAEGAFVTMTRPTEYSLGTSGVRLPIASLFELVATRYNEFFSLNEAIVQTSLSPPETIHYDFNLDCESRDALSHVLSSRAALIKAYTGCIKGVKMYISPDLWNNTIYADVKADHFVVSLATPEDITIAVHSLTMLVRKYKPDCTLRIRAGSEYVFVWDHNMKTNIFDEIDDAWTFSTVHKPNGLTVKISHTTRPTEEIESCDLVRTLTQYDTTSPLTPLAQLALKQYMKAPHVDPALSTLYQLQLRGVRVAPTIAERAMAYVSSTTGKLVIAIAGAILALGGAAFGLYKLFSCLSGKPEAAVTVDDLNFRAYDPRGPLTLQEYNKNAKMAQAYEDAQDDPEKFRALKALPDYQAHEHAYHRMYKITESYNKDYGVSSPITRTKAGKKHYQGSYNYHTDDRDDFDMRAVIQEQTLVHTFKILRDMNCTVGVSGAAYQGMFIGGNDILAPAHLYALVGPEGTYTIHEGLCDCPARACMCPSRRSWTARPLSACIEADHFILRITDKTFQPKTMKYRDMFVAEAGITQYSEDAMIFRSIGKSIATIDYGKTLQPATSELLKTRGVDPTKFFAMQFGHREHSIKYADGSCGEPVLSVRGSVPRIMGFVQASCSLEVNCSFITRERLDKLIRTPISDFAERASFTEVPGIQTHEHADLPPDGKSYKHTHECEKCGGHFSHAHPRRSMEVSQANYTHICKACKRVAHVITGNAFEVLPFMENAGYKSLHVDVMASKLIELAHQHNRYPPDDDPDSDVLTIGKTNVFKPENARRGHCLTKKPLGIAWSAQTIADVKYKDKIFKSKNGEQCIAYNQIRQYGTRDTPFTPDPSALIRTESIYAETLRARGYVPRFLTMSETINGIYNPADPLYNALAAIDMTKSPGFTLRKFYKITTKGDCFRNVSPEGTRAHYVLDEAKKTTVYIRTVIRRWFDMAAKGETLVLFNDVNIKDELLPQEKVDIGKSRTFINPDLVAIMIMRIVDGSHIAHSVANRDQGFAQVGIDPLTEFSRLLHQVYRNGGKVDPADVSRQDKNIPLEMRFLVARARASIDWDTTGDHYWFGRILTQRERENVLIARIRLAVHSPLVLPTGRICVIPRGVISGEAGTSIEDSDNVLVNDIYTIVRAIDISRAPTTKYFTDYPEFKQLAAERYPHGVDIVRDVVLPTYGDDNIYQSLRYPIHPNLRAAIWREVGMTLTPINKVADDGLELPFLSRELLTVREFPGIVLPALKTTSLIRALYYCRGKTLDISQVCQNWSTVLQEATLHGRDYHTHVKQEILAMRATFPASWQQEVDEVLSTRDYARDLNSILSAAKAGTKSSNISLLPDAFYSPEPSENSLRDIVLGTTIKDVTRIKPSDNPELRFWFDLKSDFSFKGRIMNGIIETFAWTPTSHDLPYRDNAAHYIVALFEAGKLEVVGGKIIKSGPDHLPSFQATRGYWCIVSGTPHFLDPTPSASTKKQAYRNFYAAIAASIQQSNDITACEDALVAALIAGKLSDEPDYNMATPPPVKAPLDFDPEDDEDTIVVRVAMPMRKLLRAYRRQEVVMPTAPPPTVDEITSAIYDFAFRMDKDPVRTITQPSIGHTAGGGGEPVPMGMPASIATGSAPAVEPIIPNVADTTAPAYEEVELLPGEQAFNVPSSNVFNRTVAEMACMPVDISEFTISSGQGAYVKLWSSGYDPESFLNLYGKLLYYSHANYIGNGRIILDFSGPPMTQGSIVIAAVRDIAQVATLTNVSSIKSLLRQGYWREIKVGGMYPLGVELFDARSSEYFRRVGVDGDRRPGIVVFVYQPIANQFATETELIINVKVQACAAGPESAHPFTVFEVAPDTVIQAGVTAMKAAWSPTPSKPPTRSLFAEYTLAQLAGLKRGQGQMYTDGAASIAWNHYDAISTVPYSHMPLSTVLAEASTANTWSEYNIALAGRVFDATEDKYTVYYTLGNYNDIEVRNLTNVDGRPDETLALYIQETTGSARGILARGSSGEGTPFPEMDFVREYRAVTRHGTIVWQTYRDEYGFEESPAPSYVRRALGTPNLAAAFLGDIKYTTPLTPLPNNTMRLVVSDIPAANVPSTYRLQPTASNSPMLTTALQQQVDSLGGASSSEVLRVTLSLRAGGVSICTMEFNPRTFETTLYAPSTGFYLNSFIDPDDVLLSNPQIVEDTSAKVPSNLGNWTSRFGTRRSDVLRFEDGWHLDDGITNFGFRSNPECCMAHVVDGVVTHTHATPGTCFTCTGEIMCGECFTHFKPGPPGTGVPPHYDVCPSCAPPTGEPAVKCTGCDNYFQSAYADVPQPTCLVCAGLVGRADSESDSEIGEAYSEPDQEANYDDICTECVTDDCPVCNPHAWSAHPTGIFERTDHLAWSYEQYGHGFPRGEWRPVVSTIVATLPHQMPVNEADIADFGFRAAAATALAGGLASGLGSAFTTIGNRRHEKDMASLNHGFNKQLQENQFGHNINYQTLGNQHQLLTQGRGFEQQTAMQQKQHAQELLLQAKDQAQQKYMFQTKLGLGSGADAAMQGNGQGVMGSNAGSAVVKSPHFNNSTQTSNSPRPMGKVTVGNSRAFIPGTNFHRPGTSTQAGDGMTLGTKRII